jgi:hypothetical protein
MDCPRCDRALDRYALRGREAVACGSCGYIGVPVEHRGDLREVESWDDAISRVQEVDRVEAGTVETGAAIPTPEAADGDGEPTPTVVRVEGDDPAEAVAGDGSDVDPACAVCGKRFDSRAQLNGHMAVHSAREE